MKRFSLTALRWILAIVVLSTLFLPVPVEAGGIVGSGTPQSCTEAALDSVLSNGGSITFNCGDTPHTIPLTSPKTITHDTAINGQQLITLSGRNLIRLFSVAAGATLRIQRLTLANGIAANGGAVYNAGNVEITNGTLFNNQAGSGSGGSIYNLGNLSITNSRLTNNVAGIGLGGAIYNAGVLLLQGSTFSNNYAGLAGGAIWNVGTVSITQVTFNNNSGFHGGGLENTGTARITGSTFSSNTTTGGMGGAIHNTGLLTVLNSTVSANSTSAGENGGGLSNLGNAQISTSLFIDNLAPEGMGGGIYNGGQLTIQADTLAANQANSGRGGGLYSGITGSLSIINATLSGNYAGYDGGGLDVDGPATILNSTFFKNLPNSLVHNGSAMVSVKNTIIAGSPTGNCVGTITSLGNNLEDQGTCGLTAFGDHQNTNPMLGPLANNGGPTPTHVLLPDSPAVNAGSNDGCPAGDQQGIRRPIFGICDIGAYEYGFLINMPLVVK
jgi:hypothetical protein